MSIYLLFFFRNVNLNEILTLAQELSSYRYPWALRSKESHQWALRKLSRGKRK